MKAIDSSKCKETLSSLGDHEKHIFYGLHKSPLLEPWHTPTNLCCEDQKQIPL